MCIIHPYHIEQVWGSPYFKRPWCWGEGGAWFISLLHFTGCPPLRHINSGLCTWAHMYTQSHTESMTSPHLPSCSTNELMYFTQRWMKWMAGKMYSFLCSENLIFSHDAAILGVGSKLKISRSSEDFCNFELWAVTRWHNRTGEVFFLVINLWSHLKIRKWEEAKWLLSAR